MADDRFKVPPGYVPSELTGMATQIVGVTCEKCGRVVWLNIDFVARPLTRPELGAWEKAAEVPE